MNPDNPEVTQQDAEVTEQDDAPSLSSSVSTLSVVSRHVCSLQRQVNGLHLLVHELFDRTGLLEDLVYLQRLFNSWWHVHWMGCELRHAAH